MSRLNLPALGPQPESFAGAEWVGRLRERRIIAEALRDNAKAKRILARTFMDDPGCRAFAEMEADLAEDYAAEIDPDTKEKP